MTIWNSNNLTQPVDSWMSQLSDCYTAFKFLQEFSKAISFIITITSLYEPLDLYIKNLVDAF